MADNDRTRTFGLIHIAEGVALVILGPRAPSWTFRWALRRAWRRPE